MSVLKVFTAFCLATAILVVDAGSASAGFLRNRCRSQCCPPPCWTPCEQLPMQRRPTTGRPLTALEAIQQLQGQVQDLQNRVNDLEAQRTAAPSVPGQ
jgi:hypothetical protein